MSVTKINDAIIDQDELDFSALMQTVPGEYVYYAKGSIDEYFLAALASGGADFQKYFQPEQTEVFYFLGELAEKPGKVEGKCDAQKTKHYLIPGRRSSSIELTINGLSEKQKAYLEGQYFSGVAHTIVISDRALESYDVEEESPNIVVLNGLIWRAEWSGEADGLWSVVISSEIQGRTEGLIIPAKVPVCVEPEA